MKKLDVFNDERKYRDNSEIFTEISDRLMTSVDIVERIGGLEWNFLVFLGVPRDVVWFEIADGLWCQAENAGHILKHCGILSEQPGYEELTDEQQREIGRLTVRLPKREHWIN